MKACSPGQSPIDGFIGIEIAIEIEFPRLFDFDSDFDRRYPTMFALPNTASVIQNATGGHRPEAAEQASAK